MSPQTYLFGQVNIATTQSLVEIVSLTTGQLVGRLGAIEQEKANRVSGNMAGQRPLKVTVGLRMGKNSPLPNRDYEANSLLVKKTKMNAKIEVW